MRSNGSFWCFYGGSKIDEVPEGWHSSHLNIKAFLIYAREVAVADIEPETVLNRCLRSLL